MPLKKFISRNPLLVSCLLLALSLALLFTLAFYKRQSALEDSLETELNRKASIVAIGFLSGLSPNHNPASAQERINKLVSLVPEIKEVSYFLPFEGKFKIVASSNKEMVNTVEKTKQLEKAWRERRTYSVLERRKSGRGLFFKASISTSPSSSVERIFDGVFPVFGENKKMKGLLRLRFSYFDVDYIFSNRAAAEKRVFFLLGFSSLALFLFFGFWANKMTNRAAFLTETTKAKDELLSFAAHELNSPLANIKGSLAVILEEESVNLPENLKKIGRRALVSVEQLIALVEDLLTVSRFERGKIEIYPRPIHLEDVYRLVVSQFSKLAEEKKLRLVYKEPSPALPKVIADPDKMREVLTNFLSNALKYTQEGEITLWAEVLKREVVTRVSDTGVGMDEEDLSKLFTRFGRLKRTIKTKGTGLGLYITRLIVEAHHGKIWAESTLGKGSVFSFSLPIPKSAAKEEVKDNDRGDGRE